MNDTHAIDPPQKDSAGAPRGLVAFEILLIFLVFFLQGAWPTPEVNEAHYLSKAKHYWNPEWCANDFFCNTADAHQMFYWTVGWLTLWLPLPVVAWCGRLTIWALMAWAWRRLSVAVAPWPLYSVLTAALFVTLVDRFQMAGEWFIGGVEAKGFAYVFVFLGLEALVRGQWKWVWPAMGAAGAFHVIVGGWCVVAAAFAWLNAGKTRPSVRSQLLPLVVGFLLTLPGLLPAVLLTRGAPPEEVAEANRIYVYERLPHHLAPYTFPVAFMGRFSFLVLATLLLCYWTRANPALARLRGFIIGSLGIAAAGIGISMMAGSYPELTTKLLRFYWFRMSDVIVPLGAALMLGWLIGRERLTRLRIGNLLLVVAMFSCLAHGADVFMRRRNSPRPLADKNIAELADWRATCQWIDENLPEDALFLTPRAAPTFRWYAGRAEVANWKDIPQDAQSIVAWRDRLEDIHRMYRNGRRSVRYESLTELSPARLARLAKKYDFQYIVTEASPPLPLKRVSPAGHYYAVYEAPVDDAAKK
jgi:hypothetical protein